MPLDSEKKRLEARLLNLLSQALQERNRDDIVGTSLELGALYLSGDLYEKAEECFQRVLEEPVLGLARASEVAQAEVRLAEVALRRGHLTLAAEALARAEKNAKALPETLLDLRQTHCQLDLQSARYRDVVDSIEATLERESPEKLGDTRVDFMVLEARARSLLGRNGQAQRLLEKALELAEQTGYEAGTASAHSELAALLTTLGRFKEAQKHIEEALRSDEGMGSQFRLDLDRRRLGFLHLRMGRWSEAEPLLRASYESSRDLRTLENRLGSQLVCALLSQLRGQLDEAHDNALDAMEVARAAGYVQRHVQGLVLLGSIALEKGEASRALETLKEAEALYSRVAPEGHLMLRVHALLGRCHGALDQKDEARERLTRAHSLARETANDYERYRIDSFMALHHRKVGDLRQAGEMLTRAASDLGGLGAKYDLALARLWYADLLSATRLTRDAAEREKETKLARSNLFEARRLLEPMQAELRLLDCAAVDSRLQPETPAQSPPNSSSE